MRVCTDIKVFSRTHESIPPLFGEKLFKSPNSSQDVYWGGWILVMGKKVLWNVFMYEKKKRVGILHRDRKKSDAWE